MEMLERCPGCSIARESEPKKAQSGSDAGARLGRPCAHCGYDGPFPAPEPEVAAPRDSLPNFAGARAKLATATQDLFRLSGNYSIPVEATAKSEPPAPSVPEPISSARKPEASMMFSLEALMKSTQPSPKRQDDTLDEASSQLWSMQAATPLFGTSHDQALLTTPLKMEPALSVDSMTLPSQTPNGRRWWPIVLAVGGLALAGGGVFLFRTTNGTPPANAATPSAEQASLAAQPLAEPAAPAGAAVEKQAGEGAESGKSSAASGLVAAGTAAAGTAAVGTTASGTAVAGTEGSAPQTGGAADSATPSSEPKPASGGAVEAAAGDSAVKAGRASSPKVDSSGKPAKKPVVHVDKPVAAPQLAAAVFGFDKNAAKSALNDAAQASASCGAGGSPGKGKIQVTFAPTGKVSDAQLVEGPFAGTSAGKCALRNFKAAKVPAFSGAPITVAKSFKVD